MLSITFLHNSHNPNVITFQYLVEMVKTNKIGDALFHQNMIKSPPHNHTPS